MLFPALKARRSPTPPTRVPTVSGATQQAWRLPASTVLPWAVLIAVAMSTQFLFQPFVWRNRPVDEVMLGWVEVIRDRVVVALSIALALVLGGRAPVRTLGMRSLVLVAAIVFGATAGELVLVAFDAPGAPGDARSVFGRALRWSVVAGSVAAMFFIWQRTADARAAMQATELRRAQMERQIAQSRLQMLRSQIEPHFLFNTLATVRRLHHTEPAQGAQLLTHFLDYLRLTLPTLHDEGATLGQEIDLVQAYLGVVAVRMSGRLQVSFEVPDELRACEFPALSIATLVENAVKHGIAPAPAGGAIRVQARRIGATLEVSVADTGIGFSGSGGSGIGLANIRARLHTLYGDAGVLTLEANEPNGVRACIRLPERRREGAA